MKRFIRKTVLFIVIPMLATILFDFWLRNQDSLYKEKYNGAINQKDSIQVLILGNSHATYAVDPACFEEYYAYNIANVNQFIYFDKRLTLKLINEGIPNLRYVFISVDYHSLYNSSQGIRDIWSFYGNGIKYKDKDYTYCNISPFLWGYTPSVAFSLLKKKLIRYWHYGDRPILDFDVEQGVSITDTIYRGFISYTDTDYDSFNKLKYKNRAEEFDEPEISEREDVLNDLTDFIIQLKKDSIIPILFSSPTYIEYNSYLNSEIIRCNQININGICSKYNLEYWDCTKDINFKKEDFYNYDHLNKRGAKKFSKILANKLHEYSTLKPLR